MRLMRRILRDIGILALVILGTSAGVLPSARPALAQGSDEGWAPVTVVYSSDVKGHIEPCG